MTDELLLNALVFVGWPLLLIAGFKALTLYWELVDQNTVMLPMDTPPAE
ncbi:hypothetical protein [Teichococcus wenyumeiae]|nr:hypothetical protein [Pseudoroseomonas wenyumeiae]